ncbi:MAG: hypothetical protein GX775_03560 [Erysipelothrix sp.]|nr:hypothetical protein [Erysipelothrix sp.]
MIIVFSPLQREFIKQLFDAQTYEGVSFEWVKQEGMKLFFRVNPDEESAVKVAKKVIKASKYGASLNFMVDYQADV